MSKYQYHPDRLGLIPESEMSSFRLQEMIVSAAVIVFVFAVIIGTCFVLAVR